MEWHLSRFANYKHPSLHCTPVWLIYNSYLLKNSDVILVSRCVLAIYSVFERGLWVLGSPQVRSSPPFLRHVLFHNLPESLHRATPRRPLISGGITRLLQRLCTVKTGRQENLEEWSQQLHAPLTLRQLLEVLIREELEFLIYPSISWNYGLAAGGEAWQPAIYFKPEQSEQTWRKLL